MTAKGKNTHGVVIVNLQKDCVLRTGSLRAFVQALKQRLHLGHRQFNVCLVNDNLIRRLNAAFRGKDKATDVLSFPWNDSENPLSAAPQAPARRGSRPGITNFLGDIVISVPTAQRNARTEGHPTIDEVRWLILHGVLHLLGYDHETDNGEMVARELALREDMGISGSRVKAKSKRRGHKSGGKTEIVLRLSL